MSSTITIPTSVTCMENAKIASLGQNHFFRFVLNLHLLLQLIYFKLFYFCHIWFKFVFTHNPLWVWSFSQIINFEFTDTVKSRNNNILYYMEASISSVRSTGTLKTDSFWHRDEKMKAKMAEQTADFTALLVAFVARLRSQYGVNMVKSVATWSKVNILAVSEDMDPKTWKWQEKLMSIEVQSISKPDFAVFEV